MEAKACRTPATPVQTGFEDAAGAIRIAAQYAMLFAVRTTQPQILQPVHRLRQQRRHGRLK